MSPNRRYPLELDQTEVERYRTMAEAARQAEVDLWEPAGIVAGARVADVGCGPGAMLPALAAAGLANVAVREGRADATGLEAGSLDVVMLRHVLAHNGGAEDFIVAHLATLVRPGGCLYLVDADGTAIRVIPEAEHPDLVELQKRYLAFRAARGDDNAAGLRLAERLVGGRPGAGRVPGPLCHPGGVARAAVASMGGPGGDGRGRHGDRRGPPALGPGLRGDGAAPADLFRPDVHRHRPPPGAQKSLRRSDSMPLSSS